MAQKRLMQELGPLEKEKWVIVDVGLTAKKISRPGQAQGFSG
jgi:hypothetical protein